MEKVGFLADECVFKLTFEFIKNLGFDILRSQDMELTGAEDIVIYNKAQELKRVLITIDQGFADIREYLPIRHNGIIVLKIKPHPKSVQKVHRILEVLLNREKIYKGILFVVDEKKYRKRIYP